jgi:hypothetical protein
VTVGAWLRERTPAPPARLAERLSEVLGRRSDLDERAAAACCLDAAESLLGELMADPSPGRESALDLLTVDALVTYAFEAAAREPESLEAQAASAMSRLARTASR